MFKTILAMVLLGMALFLARMHWSEISPYFSSFISNPLGLDIKVAEISNIPSCYEKFSLSTESMVYNCTAIEIVLVAREKQEIAVEPPVIVYWDGSEEKTLSSLVEVYLKYNKCKHLGRIFLDLYPGSKKEICFCFKNVNFSKHPILYVNIEYNFRPSGNWYEYDEQLYKIDLSSFSAS